MERKLRTRKILHHGVITHEEASEREDDVLFKLAQWDLVEDWYLYCKRSQNQIEHIVANHLRLADSERCELSQMQDWKYGSFNFNVPVIIHSDRRGRFGNRVLLRLPLGRNAYNAGEGGFDSLANEKVRCEVATYAWLDENCPDVPIPRLFGFSFSDGPTFSSLRTAPLYRRWLHKAQAILRKILRLPCPSQFYARRGLLGLRSPYMLIEYIEPSKGSMLSSLWDEGSDQPKLRANLCRDLSRIMLSLGRLPLPRIGSFTMDNAGIVTLTNRPLTDQIALLESAGVDSGIPRNRTYTAMEPYLLDTLKYHDNRLVGQPNAVIDEEDGREQMATLAIMRTIVSHFVSPALRDEQFAFTLTDLHRSNIFVDQDWHVTCIIDLEWACSLPLEMQQPPECFIEGAVDNLTPDDELPMFESWRQVFMLQFEQVEKEYATKGPSRAALMQTGWDSRAFFYYLALKSVTGLYAIFLQHIKEVFSSEVATPDAFRETISPFWREGTAQILEKKIRDKEEYDRRLLDAFTEH
ncbi:MAG: hypothetical protein M4579_003939 [Chaenotheca gracillima]|nr:MAG: hypothetical protein M4579_003939 [Chaenotheca gracillima]